MRHAVALSSPPLARRRDAYRRDALTSTDLPVDLDAATLAALDRLSETNAVSILRRLAGYAWHGAPNAATQRNVVQLKADGVRLIDPAEGEMACGEYGPGRLPEPQDIMDRLSDLLA